MKEQRREDLINFLFDKYQKYDQGGDFNYYLSQMSDEYLKKLINIYYYNQNNWRVKKLERSKK